MISFNWQVATSVDSIDRRNKRRQARNLPTLLSSKYTFYFLENVTNLASFLTPVSEYNIPWIQFFYHKAVNFRTAPSNIQYCDIICYPSDWCKWQCTSSKWCSKKCLKPFSNCNFLLSSLKLEFRILIRNPVARIPIRIKALRWIWKYAFRRYFLKTHVCMSRTGTYK
jgi:hypothetical protein